MADNTFTLKVISPDRVFFEGEVTMVEFNTTEGEIGIYKNHVPTTVIVKPGILKITMPEEEKKAALHAGFVEVLQDKVTILAEVIEWPGEINLTRAESARDRAKARLESREGDIDMIRAEVALQRAIARISALR